MFVGVVEDDVDDIWYGSPPNARGRDRCLVSEGKDNRLNDEAGIKNGPSIKLESMKGALTDLGILLPV